MALRSRETLRRLPLLLELRPGLPGAAGCSSSTRRARPSRSRTPRCRTKGLDTYEVLDLQQFLPGVEEAGIGLGLTSRTRLRRSGRHHETPT